MEDTALDDGETAFDFWNGPADTEWVNVGVLGYHEDGEFVLYDQPEANGVRLR